MCTYACTYGFFRGWEWEHGVYMEMAYDFQESLVNSQDQEMVLHSQEMVMAEDARSSASIARPKGEPDIFVSAFLWSILTNLDAMIVRHVERMCQVVHRAWNLERRVNYDIGEWLHANRIMYRAGQHAHGLTANVGLCCFMTQHPHDSSWTGDQTLPEHIHEVTTRASGRLYIIMEDLRDGIALPPGPYREQGVALGLNQSNFAPTVNNSMCRRQLRLLRLWNYLRDSVSDCVDMVDCNSWKQVMLIAD